MISQRINLVFYVFSIVILLKCRGLLLDHPVERDVECCIEMFRSFVSAFRSVIVCNYSTVLSVHPLISTW